MRLLLFLFYLLLTMNSITILSCSCFTRFFTRLNRILWIKQNFNTTLANARLIHRYSEQHPVTLSELQVLNKALQTSSDASSMLTHYRKQEKRTMPKTVYIKKR